MVAPAQRVEARCEVNCTQQREYVSSTPTKVGTCVWTCRVCGVGVSAGLSRAGPTLVARGAEASIPSVFLC